jgi:bifunctional DNA-binding transcriptional regulator/antitoxin component of YhaV-PrlF toxin-antitoxin module
MFSSLLRYRYAIPAVMVFLIFGCAAMQEQVKKFQQKMDRMGQINLPDPIAVSLDKMPEDAAMVTIAIHNKIVMADRYKSKNVRFEKNIDAGSFLIGKELRFSGAELYIYQTKKSSPSVKTIAGKINFEGPLGRRTSALYQSRFLSTKKEIVIKEARVEPLYSTKPEPTMFIVPAASLPESANLFPDSYTELFKLVGKKAISPSSKEVISEETEKNVEYAVFVFLLDRISPSAKLQVKVSADKTSVSGYKQATRYLDFNGWRVGILTGQFSLSGQAEPLYIKAVFVPGKEVGKIRPSRLIGRYAIHKTEPMKLK